MGNGLTATLELTPKDGKSNFLLTIRSSMLSSFVKWKLIDDRIYLLDIDSGAFFAFDGIEVEFWLSLIKNKPLRMVFKYKNQKSENQESFIQFKKELIAKGLFSKNKPAHTPSKLRSRLMHFLYRFPLSALITTKLLLKFRPFRSIYSIVSHLEYNSVKKNRFKNPTDLTPLIKNYLKFEKIFFNKDAEGDCLFRSLSLFGYMKTKSVVCKHIIGIRISPFESHAWVELNSHPILDHLDYTNQFHSLAILD